MLTQLNVTSDRGETLNLPLQDVSDGYAIVDIDGLDPVKATLVSSSFAQQDGSQYHSSRRENRNVVLTLSLEADFSPYTVTQLRSRLYSYFMTERKVLLQFITDDGKLLNISGVVESFESPRFVQEPQATISIMCFNPDLEDPTVITVAGSTVSDSTEINIPYAGTVETGFLFRLSPNRSDLNEFTIYHRGDDDQQTSLQWGGTGVLAVADELYISTVSGSKYARRVRSGSEVTMLTYVSPYSNWMKLLPGNNFFRIYAEGAAVPFTIEYTTKYGGVA